MALITRISRLFKADLHAVLDHIEEPDVLLRQAVREMQEALEINEQQVKLLQHEQSQLITRQAELEHSLGDIEEELDVCFESDNDDLARKLIKRRLEAQQFDSFLSRKRKSLEDSLNELMTRLEENQTQLESMQQKAELFAEADSSGQAEACWTTPDLSVGKEDVEVAFLREKQRRSRA